MTEETAAAVVEAPAEVETPAEVTAPVTEVVAPTAEVPAPETPTSVSVEAYGLSEDFGAALTKFATEASLGQETLDGLIASYKENAEAEGSAAQAAMRIEGDALVESWGEQKEANLASVRDSLKAVDTDGTVVKMLNDTGYGNHPAILNMFLKMGEYLKEGTYHKSGTNSPPAPRTAAEAMFGQTHPA